MVRINTNLPGHGIDVQSAVSVGLPEHDPPFLSSLFLTLVRDFNATPHDLEHDEKLDQVDHVQFSENNTVHHKKLANPWLQF